MKYVILGASAAGISGARTIREQDPDGEITIISKDEQIYSRCMLHHVISEHRSPAAISFVDPDFLQRYRICWLPGRQATKLDTKEKVVWLSDGEVHRYDRLLIATGASSFFPPIENLAQGRQVFGLRTMADAREITRTSQTVTKAVVIGAGLVGIDAAYALVRQGIKVAVIEMAGNILPLQLDSQAAKRYEQLFQDHGVEFFFNETVASVELDTNHNVRGVRLKSGQFVPGGMLVMAAGVRPNIEFLAGSSIEIGRGIKVNEYQQTSVADIFAAGDVCESVETFTGKATLTPIWPAAVRQGQVAGYNMTGKSKKMEDNFALKNSMNFFGFPTVSFGFIIPPDDEYQVLVEQDVKVYKKVILKDGRLRGAILQGDIANAGLIGTLIKDGIAVSDKQDRIFDLTYADFFAQKENGAFYFRDNKM